MWDYNAEKYEWQGSGALVLFHAQTVAFEHMYSYLQSFT